MPTIEAIYSIEKGSEVYHNHTECTERNNIETRNVRAGTGNKRLCKHCQDLATKEGMLGLGLLKGHPLFGGIRPSIFAAIKANELKNK